MVAALVVYLWPATFFFQFQNVKMVPRQLIPISGGGGGELVTNFQLLILSPNLLKFFDKKCANMAFPGRIQMVPRTLRVRGTINKQLITQYKAEYSFPQKSLLKIKN